MTITNGTVNTGTAVGNANAARAGIIAAITAHAAYTWIEQLTSGSVTVDIIKSSGSLNGTGGDWWLLLRHDGVGSLFFNITEDYDTVTKLCAKYIPWNQSSYPNWLPNSGDDGFTNPTRVNPAVVNWPGSGTTYNGPAGSWAHTFNTTTNSWWVLTNNRYLFIMGRMYGSIDIPIGTRWRRNLLMGDFLVQTGKTTHIACLRGPYGSGGTWLRCVVLSPYVGNSVEINLGTTQSWLAGGYDVNLGGVPYGRVPVTGYHPNSGSVLFGHLPNILWLPYGAGQYDTISIAGEPYRLIGGYCWHKVSEE